jgi:hypothetical protein
MQLTTFKYSGRSVIYKTVKPASSDQICKNAAFIIINSRPYLDKVSNLPPSLIEYSGTEILNYQLDVIEAFCYQPEIIVVGGHKINKILKFHRRAEYCIIENNIHDVSNSAEDVRIGVNASLSSPVFFLRGEFVPSYGSFEKLFNAEGSATLYRKLPDYGGVGMTLDKSNKIKLFSYKENNKFLGLTKFCHADMARLKKKVCSATCRKNMFDFELFEEFKVTAVEDTSKSFLNYDN